MGLQEDFEAAAASIMQLTVKPTNDELLELYALFKQASEGDVKRPKPGMLDLRGRKKWEAWNSRKGMCAEDAVRAYIQVVERLLVKYAANTGAKPLTGSARVECHVLAG